MGAFVYRAAEMIIIKTTTVIKKQTAEAEERKNDDKVTHIYHNSAIGYTSSVSDHLNK